MNNLMFTNTPINQSTQKNQANPETNTAKFDGDSSNQSTISKHLEFSRQQSSNSMKHKISDDTFSGVAARRQQKQNSKRQYQDQPSLFLNDNTICRTITMKELKSARKAKKTLLDMENDLFFEQEDLDIENTRCGGQKKDEDSISNPSSMSHISKKKSQYLSQSIKDKNGVYNYGDDASQYKKARKRLQNRESAVRSRQKKSQEMAQLADQVTLLKQDKAIVEIQNAELKKQNKYWQDLFSNLQMLKTQTCEKAEPVQSVAITKPQEPSQSFQSPEFKKQPSLEQSEPTYNNLQKSHGAFQKRQKCVETNDSFFGSNVQQTEPIQQEEHKESFIVESNLFNVDDLLVTNNAGSQLNHNNNTSFFGLAVMYGQKN